MQQKWKKNLSMSSSSWKEPPTLFLFESKTNWWASAPKLTICVAHFTLLAALDAYGWNSLRQSQITQKNEKNIISWRNTAFVFDARFSVRRCEFMVSSMTLIDFPISKADVVSKGIRHLASREARARFDAIKKHHKTFRIVELMSFFCTKNRLGNGRLPCFLKPKTNLLSLPKFVWKCIWS